jgi:chemotaxis response regulator CheB
MAEVKLVSRRRTSSSPFLAPLGPLAPISALTPEVVAIGASTGGPPALSTLLAAVPASYRGSILVAQHLQPGFTDGLARWLQLSSPLPVMIAERPVPLATRSVILPPDGSHLVVDGGFARPEPGERGTLVPSADRLFSTCALGMRARALGVLLTGMGADGAAGLKEMRRQGAWTIVQDESTSVVFGMPAAAAKEGAACEILPLPAIAQKLAQLLETGRR